MSGAPVGCLEILLSTGDRIHVAALTLDENLEAIRMDNATPPGNSPDTLLPVILGRMTIVRWSLINAGASPAEAEATVRRMRVTDIRDTITVVMNLTYTTHVDRSGHVN